jgi:hypothetical protein
VEQGRSPRPEKRPSTTPMGFPQLWVSRNYGFPATGGITHRAQQPRAGAGSPIPREPSTHRWSTRITGAQRVRCRSRLKWAATVLRSGAEMYRPGQVVADRDVVAGGATSCSLPGSVL